MHRARSRTAWSTDGLGPTWARWWVPQPCSPSWPGELSTQGTSTTLPGAVPTAQTLVTLLFGLLAPPDMMSATGAPGNVALAAPAPIPDADLDDVLAAVQTAAEGLLDDLGKLPDDVAQFVQNVAEFPQSLPLEVVKLVNARIDAVQVAGKTVGLTVFGTLPEDLRAPAAALPLAIEGVIDDVQLAVEDAATPTPQPLQATQAGGGPQLQRLGGTGLDNKDQVGDPGVPPEEASRPVDQHPQEQPAQQGRRRRHG